VVNVETKVRKIAPQTSKSTCKKRLWGIGCKIGKLTLGTLWWWSRWSKKTIWGGSCGELHTFSAPKGKWMKVGPKSKTWVRKREENRDSYHHERAGA